MADQPKLETTAEWRRAWRKRADDAGALARDFERIEAHVRADTAREIAERIRAMPVRALALEPGATPAVCNNIADAIERDFKQEGEGV